MRMSRFPRVTAALQPGGEVCLAAQTRVRGTAVAQVSLQKQVVEALFVVPASRFLIQMLVDAFQVSC